MGNRTSRVVECFVPIANGKGGVDLEFLEPLDEGLGHSFCYVRPVITDSPTITPSNSERFTVYSSTLDSETQSGSFGREIVEDSLGLQRPNKNFPETTFKTISGASVSANVLTARFLDRNDLFTSDAQEPAASFESTSSFAAIPLQPVPRGSGPLNGFMSGPLERGFASGPLERGAGFMSGPIEKGVFMSGPLDDTDRSNFSAPLAFNRRRAGFGRLVRSMSRPMRSALSQTFVRHSVGSGWMRRFFLHPVTRFAWHPREGKLRNDVPRSCFEEGPPVGEYSKTRNLQWAHGKAGEDRVHVVLSEEQGWLFVGIYDGFSGPDAPDFLMRNLYRAIDKELEGLLWDYEDKSGTNSHVPGLVEKDSARSISDCGKENHLFSQPCGDNLEKLCTMESMKDAWDVDGNEQKRLDMERTSADQSVQADEIGADKHGYGAELQLASEINEELEKSTGTGNVEMVGHSGPSEQIAITDQKAQLAGHGRKSKRLYELLEMDGWDVWGFASESEVSSWRRRASWDLQPNEKDLNSRENLPEAKSTSRSKSNQGSSSNQLGEDINTREHAGIVKEKSKNGIAGSFPIPKQNQVKRSLIGSKLKTICRKQKSLRKKLLPWNYDWHRDGTHVEKPVFDSLVPLRTCKSAPIDHEAVLSAMSRALESTEEAYMEMVEKALDRNPELALMGSCVLVMLMKDQDVYVMNLGDSRVILAQEGPDNGHENPDVVKDDSGHWKRSRESLIRVELDRISEESPMRNQTIEVSNLNKSRGISICRLKMRALQLSTDHNTNIEEEVLRIKSEHADDNQAMLNDRVKGQLKVTRAFGAGFLKKPKCNEALLEMFRIDYVGNAPYLSCIPSVRHHRLCSNDRFLVLSSDGLYEYFSNEEVVSHVGWFMENVPDGDPAQYLIAELLFRAAKKNGMDFHELLDIPHGDRRKYHDDISVMVISLEGRIWRSSG